MSEISELFNPETITAILGLVSVLGGGLFLRAKQKLQQVTNFVNILNEAMLDDKVTNDEFDRIYHSAKAILRV